MCHNHKFWYSYVILCGLGVYQLFYGAVVGYYVNSNYHRSLEYAILKETEWQKNKPEDDDDDFIRDAQKIKNNLLNIYLEDLCCF